jgi:hypothetical protein
MIFAEDIRNAILKLAAQRGPEKLFYPREVAKMIDPENWIAQVEQVNLVAESLIREGQITAAPTDQVIEKAYTKQR